MKRLRRILVLVSLMSLMIACSTTSMNQSNQQSQMPLKQLNQQQNQTLTNSNQDLGIVEEDSSVQSDLIDVNDLSDYIVLTEDEFKDIVTKASNDAVAESIQSAVESERQRFYEIEKEFQNKIDKLQESNTIYKGAVIGLSITTGVSILSLLAVMFIPRR